VSLYSKFVKHVTYPLINRREGIKGVYAHLKELEKSQYYSLDSLEALQLERLKNLLVHARENAPFYRKRFKDAGFNPASLKYLDDLKKIPVLTKDDILANLDQLVAKNFREKEIHESHTGGTTGVKVHFYRDNGCLALKEAVNIRCERWTGWEIGEAIGIVWPAMQDYLGKITSKTALKNSIWKREYVLPAAVLTEEDMRKYYVLLRGKKPSLIKAFPYSLFLFAKYMLENELVDIRPNGIVTTGEPLYKQQREIIERVFNTKIFDSYGSRETSTIAQECEIHGGYHINAEAHVVEFLSSEGMPIEPGKRGEIITTDLFNFGMPFIRYAVGDTGVKSPKKCSCGRNLPLMEKVHGRVFDEIVSPTGRKVSPITFFISLGGEGPDIGQIQIIQESLSHITVRVTKEPKPDPEIYNYYPRMIKRIMGESVTTMIELVDEIPREASGKFRCVKSLIEHKKNSQP